MFTLLVSDFYKIRYVSHCKQYYGKSSSNFIVILFIVCNFLIKFREVNYY